MMDRTASHRPRRTFARTLALAALLGLATIGLSQCRVADGGITGVELAPAGATNGNHSCLKACAREFKADVKNENARYRLAVRDCNRDRECIDEERDEHRDRLRALALEYQQCRRGCYNEGSGAGGR